MSIDKAYIVGEVMHIGSDNDYVIQRRECGANTDSPFDKIHHEDYGRNPQFGPFQNHDARVIGIKGTTVHVLCACGSGWDFQQPDSQNDMSSEFIELENKLRIMN